MHLGELATAHFHCLRRDKLSVFPLSTPLPPQRTALQGGSATISVRLGISDCDTSSAIFEGYLMRKSGVLTLLLAGVLTLGATATRAAGGACPSTAQYINTANPTGPLVTLASLGVTSCFYVADSGADTNSGTTEAAPFLHAPFMPN